jgi:hypothetical protein
VTESPDIQFIVKALRSFQRSDLARLFQNATSELRVSDTYGSRWFSRVSAFDIYCTPEKLAVVRNLPDEDKKLINDAVLLRYPTRDNEPEICEINYLMRDDEGFGSEVSVPALRVAPFDYMREQVDKCESKIDLGDFEGAVTNARTLVETVCLFIHEELTGSTYSYDGNLPRLHKSVADSLKMNPDLFSDQNLKRILSAVGTIIQGIAELRNAKSDAHGKGRVEATYRIDRRHAVLVVNLAKTISEYLYLTLEKRLMETR